MTTNEGQKKVERQERVFLGMLAWSLLTCKPLWLEQMQMALTCSHKILKGYSNEPLPTIQHWPTHGGALVWSWAFKLNTNNSLMKNKTGLWEFQWMFVFSIFIFSAFIVHVMTHLRIKQTQANDQAKVAVSGCSNKEQCFNSVTEPKCTLFGEIYNSFSYSCQNIATSTNTALNMFLLLSSL